LLPLDYFNKKAAGCQNALWDIDARGRLAVGGRCLVLADPGGFPAASTAGNRGRSHFGESRRGDDLIRFQAGGEGMQAICRRVGWQGAQLWLMFPDKMRCHPQPGFEGKRRRDFWRRDRNRGAGTGRAFPGKLRTLGAHLRPGLGVGPGVLSVRYILKISRMIRTAPVTGPISRIIMRQKWEVICSRRGAWPGSFPAPKIRRGMERGKGQFPPALSPGGF